MSVAQESRHDQTALVRGNWDKIVDLVGNENRRLAVVSREALVLRVFNGVAILAFKASFHANCVGAEPDALADAIFHITGVEVAVRTITLDGRYLAPASRSERDYQNALRLAFEAGRAYERATRAELDNLDQTWHPDVSWAGQVAIRAARYGPGRDLILDDPAWPTVRVPGAGR